jgi:hypothetical protein
MLSTEVPVANNTRSDHQKYSANVSMLLVCGELTFHQEMIRFFGILARCCLGLGLVFKNLCQFAGHYLRR